MKKLQFVFLAVIAAFAFASCDELVNTVEDLTDNDLVGHASIAISHTNDSGTTVDSLKFKSSIVDALEMSMYDTTLPAGYFTVDISANVDFGTSNVELQYPFMFYRLNDTVAGTYQMENILTLEMLQNLNIQTLVNTIANPSGPNMIIIAESDTSWYLTFGGNLIVTEYPTVGNLVKANLSSINARFITQSKVEELNSDIENNNYSHLSDLGYYFPEVTLTGNVTSRRWAVARTVYETAFVNGGIVSK
ncbi:MAG: hypothetical protein K5842_02625 [Bacteroidales bacterium]|nr:hypothetical protein [Bacteroidales bacterium]